MNNEMQEIIRRVIGIAQESKNQVARGEMIKTLYNAGTRLAEENLDTYLCRSEGQENLLKLARAYLDDIEDNVRRGTNIFLYGNTGVGKDHICMGIAVAAYRRHGIATRMLSGYQLRARFTEAVAEHESLSQIAEWFYSPDILWISDPVESGDAMTATELKYFYSVVDTRYKNQRPTWITTNITSVGEAAKSIGAASTDRLKGGAFKFDCDWESYR